MKRESRSITTLFFIIMTTLVLAVLTGAPGVLAQPADDEPSAEELAAEDEGFAQEQAGEEEEKPKYFSFDVGIKGNYSTGGAPKNLYYYPFIDGDFTYKWFSLTAGYTFYGNYQLSDAAGDYSRIYYHQFKVGTAANIKDIVSLSAEYQLSTGQQKYRGHSITPAIDIEYKKFYMSTNASFSKTQYGYVNSFYNWFDPISNSAQPQRYQQYDSNLIKRQGWSASAYTGVYVHKTTGLELGYTHSEEYTESLSTSGFYYLTAYNIIPTNFFTTMLANRLVNKTIKYYSNTVSLGLNTRPIDQLSLQGAFNIGKDSAKYITAGLDLGITAKLFKVLKISITYTPTRYIPPDKTGAEKLQEFGAELRKLINIRFGQYNQLVSDYYYEKYANTRGNPDLSETSGKAYWAHNLNFGVTYSY